MQLSRNIEKVKYLEKRNAINLIINPSNISIICNSRGEIRLKVKSTNNFSYLSLALAYK
jgi:hypothetical protein